MRFLNKEQLEYTLPLLVGILAFIICAVVVGYPFLFAISLTLPCIILSWGIIRRIRGQSIDLLSLLESVAIILGLIVAFSQIQVALHQIEQIRLQPELDLNCQEIITQYRPHLWAGNPVVLYRPNQTFKPVSEPILFVITNEGGARAVNPRLYVRVKTPFRISIFGIRSNENWWSWVEEPVSEELRPEKFSWIAGENYKSVTLTLYEILPTRSLNAYFLLVTSDTSKEPRARIKARITGIDQPKQREFIVSWKGGKVKCED